MRDSCGTILRFGKHQRGASGTSSTYCPCASTTRFQSASERKSARRSVRAAIIDELSVSPLSRRRKISVASSKILFFTTGHAAASTGFRGTMPYGMLMNGKRPEAKPIVSVRRSAGSRPCRARKVLIRSACATGPPLQRMFRMAEPMPMRRVRAKTRWASWRMSVFSPISPTKCGMTAPGLVFCTSVERWLSATHAVPNPSRSASSICSKKFANIVRSSGK